MKLSKKILRESVLREIHDQVFSPKKKTILVKGMPVDVEIADTSQKRDEGLMFRRSLEKDSGMLFDFMDTDRRGFWMKNTSIPLSIAFIDSDGKIVNIEDMEPFSLSSSYSASPCRYALEMNKGWFRKNKIFPGDSCKL